VDLLNGFRTELDARRRGGRWHLDAELVYACRDGTKITVPAGFDTDFASVPRLPLVFLCAGDAAHEAAVVHDFLYRAQTLSRRRADAIFREAMACTPCCEPWWRRWLMWVGLRLFGWAAWRSNRRVLMARRRALERATLT